MIISSLVFRSPRMETAAAAFNGHLNGSALLLVIGATAALGALVTLLLSLSLLAYEGAALRVDGTQARLLARSGILEVETELAAGRILVPSGGIVWDGTVPTAPPGIDSMPAAAKPEILGAPGSGCGFRVSLARVLRPGGALQSVILDGVPDSAMLVDARAVGWCGRGAAEIDARFAVVPGKIAVRLH
jgi:hypothetical protein